MGVDDLISDSKLVKGVLNLLKEANTGQKIKIYSLLADIKGLKKHTDNINVSDADLNLPEIYNTVLKNRGIIDN